MSYTAFLSSLQQGLIFSFVALGLFVSFRILNMADLTSDGSFTLGAAISSVLTLAGHPFLGLAAAFLFGSFAGFATAFLQTKLKIAPILSGIITMTALYSINLSVMGSRANINLLRCETVFDFIKFKTLFLFMVSALSCLLLYLFLKTGMGLALRATGDNETMVRASSINPSFSITLGLMLSNALIALSGAFLSQYQLFCEITMGTGVVVLGLASLIIGEVVLLCHRRKTVAKGIGAAIIGAVIYRIIMSLALEFDIAPQNLKLFSALIVIAAISYPTIISEIAFRRSRREKYKNA